MLNFEEPNSYLQAHKRKNLCIDTSPQKETVLDTTRQQTSLLSAHQTSQKRIFCDAATSPL